MLRNFGLSTITYRRLLTGDRRQTKQFCFLDADWLVVGESQSSSQCSAAKYPVKPPRPEDDLQWSTHIQSITKKANSTLGFLRRNLKNCHEECRKLAYISLVRSTLEYGSSIWDAYLQKDINSIEKVQRQAARFIKGDHKSCEEGCVTNILNDLDLPSLQQRREFNKLVFLFKIAGVWCRPLTHVIISHPKNLKDGLRLNNSVTISVQI